MTRSRNRIGIVTGERGNEEDFGQMRPVRPAKPSQRAKRHVQDVLRQDRDTLPLMCDAVDFQAQPRRLIGAGV